MWIPCAILMLLAGSVSSYYQGYPTYYYLTNKNHYTRHKNLICGFNGCFRLNVCQNWCYIRQTNWPYYCGYKCCSYVERAGTCPVEYRCSWPLHEYFTRSQRCYFDVECPEGYKCCKDSCYSHKICKPYTFYPDVPTITLKPPIIINGGTSEATTTEEWPFEETTETAESGEEMTEPTTTADSGEEITEPEEEITEPTTQTEPEEEITEPAEEITESTTQTESGEEITEPGEEITEPTTTKEPEEEITEPEEEITEPEEEITEPGEETTEPTTQTDPEEEITEPTTEADSENNGDAPLEPGEIDEEPENITEATTIPEITTINIDIEETTSPPPTTEEEDYDYGETEKVTTTTEKAITTVGLPPDMEPDDDYYEIGSGEGSGKEEVEVQ